jgi:general secretion pathway protein K
MNRRGIALLSVLWLITALSVLAAGGLAAARIGLKAGANRILLERAAWAREACIEIMLARGFTRLRGGGIEVTNTGNEVSLGRETWCRISVRDPSTAVNVNLASEETLRLLLGSDSLTDALLDWRDADDSVRHWGAEARWYRERGWVQPRNGPLAAVQEIGRIRGFERLSPASLTGMLRVRGGAAVNVNGASAAVLRAAAQLPGELADLVVGRNREGRPVQGLDELIALAPPSRRPGLLARYQDLVQQVVFAPGEVAVTATGGVGSSPLTSRATLTVVAVGERIAVIRRETE